MTSYDLQERTKKFALRIIKLVDSLPRTPTSRSIGNQLLRSGTSVAANFRSARRAKSPADFIYKLAIVEEESDETLFWLEILSESGLVKASRLRGLITEANEIVAITVSSIRTARSNRNKNG